jgi:hypothetical protein
VYLLNRAKGQASSLAHSPSAELSQLLGPLSLALHALAPVQKKALRVSLDGLIFPFLDPLPYATGMKLSDRTRMEGDMAAVVVSKASLEKLAEAHDAQSLHDALSELSLSGIFRREQPTVERNGSEVVCFERKDGHFTLMRREEGRSAGVAVRIDKLQAVWTEEPSEIAAVLGDPPDLLISAKDIVDSLIFHRRV